ncbi:MAG: hypothetical protein AAGB13_02320 [Cyanobacteria bacterium P01_F01_bin.33]
MDRRHRALSCASVILNRVEGDRDRPQRKTLQQTVTIRNGGYQIDRPG